MLVTASPGPAATRPRGKTPWISAAQRMEKHAIAHPIFCSPSSTCYTAVFTFTRSNISDNLKVGNTNSWSHRPWAIQLPFVLPASPTGNADSTLIPSHDPSTPTKLNRPLCHSS